MENMQDYIHKNKDRFVSELIDLLKIPSVSADQEYVGDVAKAAEFVKQKLIDAGAENVEVCKTEGHPIVYGDKIIDASLPTVLVYGHYDVQPADPVDLWTSPPFDPVIKDDSIYARGASDDKGQMYMHIKAFETMMQNDALACNIKFLIEGEEEVGSDNLGIFVKNNKERLNSDVILISDTAMLANDTPSITVGLRGLSYVEVEVTGPNRDLHSGVYGGAVGNPIQILCEMIASMKDENNHITIQGFYDDVIEVSDEDRNEMAKAPFDLKHYKKDLNVGDVRGEKGYSTPERTSIRPTFDLNGIWGGYTGEGSKTVLPSKAYAKMSMRLVPNQSSNRITELFTKHFSKIAPNTVKVKVTPYHGGEPVVTPTDSISYKAAAKAVEKTYGVKPIPTREGGSIPIVALFEDELKVKSVLLGFGLNSDNIHSPDEHFGIFNFVKGIETIPLFFKYFAEMSAKE
jgi:acetylornithine deacetylase/succinyl-diaminopimelate desuccinylase-like protein